MVDAVEQTDLRLAVVNERGTGSAQYPPAMMLALLIYSYARGTFSSRQIEAATYDSVSTRYITGDTHPDHDTIASFRRQNGLLLKACFIRVLELAREVGLLKLGTISIDGTKVGAAASKHKNRRLGELEEQIARLKEVVASCLTQAEMADSHGQSEGLQLPDSLSDARVRLAKLQAAKVALEERLAEQTRRRAAKKQRYSGKRPPRRGAGRKANPTTEARAAADDVCKQQVSLTDPESRLMPVNKESPRGGFIQGYNAQAAVAAEGPGLVVVPLVCNAPNDREQLAPVLKALESTVSPGEVTHVLVDSGYYNSLDVAPLEATHGTRILCPPTHQNRASGASNQRYAPDHPRQVSERARRKMMRRLGTPQGKKLYARRAPASEGAFAAIKNQMGFKDFRLRGLNLVNLEWTLVTLAYNCRKIARNPIHIKPSAIKHVISSKRALHEPPRAVTYPLPMLHNQYPQ